MCANLKCPGKDRDCGACEGVRYRRRACDFQKERGSLVENSLSGTLDHHIKRSARSLRFRVVSAFCCSGHVTKTYSLQRDRPPSALEPPRFVHRTSKRARSRAPFEIRAFSSTVFASAIAVLSTHVTSAAAAVVSFNPYEPVNAAVERIIGDSAPMQQDAFLAVVSLMACTAWLLIWQVLTYRGVISSKKTRKIVHVTCAPLYMLLWPLYSSSDGARWWAAAVPLLVSARLVLAATEVIPGDPIAKGVSRSGNPEEALRGPLYYIVALLFAVVTFWRASPIGLVMMCQMCFGDGMAEPFGQKFGKLTGKWPFSSSKSLAGSAGFVLCSTITSVAFVSLFASTGVFEMDVSSPSGLQQLFLKSMAVSLISAGAELVPFGDDNINVPLVAALASYFIF